MGCVMSGNLMSLIICDSHYVPKHMKNEDQDCDWESGWQPLLPQCASTMSINIFTCIIMGLCWHVFSRVDDLQFINQLQGFYSERMNNNHKITHFLEAKHILKHKFGKTLCCWNWSHLSLNTFQKDTTT